MMVKKEHAVPMQHPGNEPTRPVDVVLSTESDYAGEITLIVSALNRDHATSAVEFVALAKVGPPTEYAVRMRLFGGLLDVDVFDFASSKETVAELTTAMSESGYVRYEDTWRVPLRQERVVLEAERLVRKAMS